jgi:cytochrome c peroxidase
VTFVIFVPFVKNFASAPHRVLSELCSPFQEFIMRRFVLLTVAALMTAASAAHAEEINQAMLAAFGPLPERFEGAEKATPEQINLGRMLYYDKRMSKSQTVSCNTCHLLDKYGVDMLPVSLGHKQQKGTRNAPTVYNAAGQFAQFWDYRAPSIEVQATMPVLNPIEMAMPSEDFVLEILNSIPGYVEAFKKAFPNDPKITYKNFGAAIGAFERGLVTPSRWDKFLKGDKNALTDDEKKGFNTFIAVGCNICHIGPNLGGMMPQKLGLIRPWPNQKDQGRFEQTKVETDKMMFKVSILRNVEKTGPYFHDGSVASLEEAVKMMAQYQSPLGQAITDDQVKSIVTFLKTLTGDLPTDYIKEPQLPPSGPNTPKPSLD